MLESLSRLVVDGVFFQFKGSGIARHWRSVLEEWSRTDFAQRVVLVDRAGTAPQIPGVRRVDLPAYDYNRVGADSQRLQDVCDAEDADLFVSTYYTTPLTTPSAFMAYDMIPEVMGHDLAQPPWREKHFALHHASGYLAISQNTLTDVQRLVPQAAHRPCFVTPCGVADCFRPATAEQVAAFRAKYRLDGPYLLFAGARDGNKNATLLLRALAELPPERRCTLVCTGGASRLKPTLATLAQGQPVTLVRLTDDELSAAYSGALALVYPSLYEGFGLPIVEAMACGCPVITCRNSSIPEVAGDAAFYVSPHDPTELAAALCALPARAPELIERGLERSRHFSWATTAKLMAEGLSAIAAQVREAPSLRPASIWPAFRNMQANLEQARGELAEAARQARVQTRELKRLRQALDNFDGVGPSWIALLQRARRLAQRYPRVANVARRTLGLFLKSVRSLDAASPSASADRDDTSKRAA
jgi:glycosyltransferase involved in cell wall biosynthesis